MLASMAEGGLPLGGMAGGSGMPKGYLDRKKSIVAQSSEDASKELDEKAVVGRENVRKSLLALGGEGAIPLGGMPKGYLERKKSMIDNSTVDAPVPNIPDISRQILEQRKSILSTGGPAAFPARRPSVEQLQQHAAVSGIAPPVPPGSSAKVKPPLQASDSMGSIGSIDSDMLESASSAFDADGDEGWTGDHTDPAAEVPTVFHAGTDSTGIAAREGAIIDRVRRLSTGVGVPIAPPSPQ